MNTPSGETAFNNIDELIEKVNSPIVTNAEVNKLIKAYKIKE